MVEFVQNLTDAQIARVGPIIGALGIIFIGMILGLGFLIKEGITQILRRRKERLLIK